MNLTKAFEEVKCRYGRTQESVHACFLFAALSSVLSIKGVDTVGDCNLFL